VGEWSDEIAVEKQIRMEETRLSDPNVARPGWFILLGRSRRLVGIAEPRRRPGAGDWNEVECEEVRFVDLALPFTCGKVKSKGKSGIPKGSNKEAERPTLGPRRSCGWGCGRDLRCRW
jgi:hypothetical protein